MGRRRKLKKIYPTVKLILRLASVGAIIAGSFVLPGLPRLLKVVNFRYEDLFTEDEWEDFDERRLKEKLKELHRKKEIRIYKTGDKFIVRITKKGKRKFLKYKLDDLKIQRPQSWDGKWRIVAYDVPKERKLARDALRKTLKRLGFFELQKSVYLYPYPCGDAVEFLRELYGIGENVTLLTVGYLENEEVYRDYFDI